jgi:hypothetical protein
MRMPVLHCTAAETLSSEAQHCTDDVQHCAAFNAMIAALYSSRDEVHACLAYCCDQLYAQPGA